MPIAAVWISDSVTISHPVIPQSHRQNNIPSHYSACGSCPGGGAGSALAETIENSTAIVNVPIAIAILFYTFSQHLNSFVWGMQPLAPHARCPIAGGPVGTSSTAGRSLRVGCASGRLTASHNGVDGLSSLSSALQQVRKLFTGGAVVAVVEAKTVTRLTP